MYVIKPVAARRIAMAKPAGAIAAAALAEPAATATPAAMRRPAFKTAGTPEGLRPVLPGR